MRFFPAAAGADDGATPASATPRPRGPAARRPAPRAPPRRVAPTTLTVAGVRFLVPADVLDESDAALVEPAVYEGGHEAWECCFDLVGHLEEFGLPAISSGRRRVLELGCGLGLPGLWALRRGAAHLSFLDLNLDVLRDKTAKLVALNGENGEKTGDRAAFYAGDWHDVTPLLQEDDDGAGDDAGRYDAVVSAETVYRTDLAASLGRMLEAHLSRPKGVGFIATKRYYFGCGGGTLAFTQALPAALCAECVHSVEDGRSNVRDILRVTWRHEGAEACAAVAQAAAPTGGGFSFNFET